MYHDLPRTARFWSFLLTVDQDLAEETRKKACPCGGRLHSANYLRKPRGTPVRLPEQECLRFSFCCDRDGCRKRATPPSVRFLGRKVYLGAIVILISAMRQDPHHAASASFPHASAPTKAQSPAGRPSGANTSHKHPFGRLHAPVSSPSARSSACPTRWSTSSSAVIRRAKGGRASCGSSRPSRFPGACKSRSRHDRFRSAEDALRPRFLVGENGLSQSLHPIHEEA